MVRSDADVNNTRQQQLQYRRWYVLRAPLQANGAGDEVARAQPGCSYYGHRHTADLHVQTGVKAAQCVLSSANVETLVNSALWAESKRLWPSLPMQTAEK